MAAAASGPKAIGLELGGKSPILVFADADLDQAAELVVGGIFYNAGQMCSATSRLLVEKSVAPALLERVVVAARELKMGDPLDAATRMGPLTTRAQFDKVTSYIERGVKEGLRLLIGGGRPKGVDARLVHRADHLHRRADRSALWREEIFGPVLCTRTFASEAEAIALANDSDFGLVATIATRDDGARRTGRRRAGGRPCLDQLARRPSSSRPPGADSRAAASAASSGPGASMPIWK